jgi:adenylosuccinate lyase
MTNFQPIALPNPPTTTNLWGIDPLDGRYFDANTARFLSETARVTYQAYVEAALAQSLADEGVCSRQVADEIERAARNIDAVAVYAEEQTTKHDIKAVVNTIKSHISDEAKPFVHFGATSYDIVATAQALQIKDACSQLVVPALKQLLATLISIADEHQSTTQIGRTHGQHAVPITFGFAIAEYVSRIGHTTQAIEDLSNMLVGKFSGAVGSYNALSLFVRDPLQFEESVLAKVGLKPAEYSNQITPPETVIRIIDEMAIAGGIMANLSHDMRHLQRTEIAEVQERFEKGQTGSSTMAHKRNPWNFENVISMSKQVLAQSLNANLNISSEHQRDLTDSASSRFYAIVPASIISMAQRLNRIMSKLEVNRAAMQENLNVTGGAIAAEPLYLLLEKHGHTTAHETAKAWAHQALDSGRSLKSVIVADAEGKSYWDKLSPSEQAIIQDPAKHYTGLAAKKTALVVKRWQQYMTQ